MKFIKVTTDGEAAVINLKTGHFTELAAAIGARLIDIVPIYQDQMQIEDYAMVVDDEGLFNNGNQCNPVASVLYGVMEHGQPIVGDILFAKNSNGPDDFQDIPEREAANIKDALALMIEVMKRGGVFKRLRTKYDCSEAQPPEILVFE